MVDDASQRAGELLAEVDSIAREVCPCDYGLPLGSETADAGARMLAAVAAAIRQAVAASGKPACEWTRTPPTVPGWWWLRSDGNVNGHPIRVETNPRDGGLFVQRNDEGWPVARYTEVFGAEWAGPLEGPQ